MRLFRPCFLSGWLYPEALFRIDTGEKLLCLTFDDGPDPESTPRILEILDNYDIKALFFLDGKAAEKHPGLVSIISSKGHITGNHGYNHINGWTASTNRYVSDITNASEFSSDCLFRPPYGRLRLSQYRKLKRQFKIIFWDIMPYDFDKNFGSRNVLKVLQKKLRKGSLIVFHDTRNSIAPEILPEFINYSISKGYRFVLPVF
jgi:peptidoglycan/xylan/chitin deacetylase (PgdA/CDA1 family)